MQIVGIMAMVEIDETTANQIQSGEFDIQTLADAIHHSPDDQPAYYTALAELVEEDDDSESLRTQANRALLEHFIQMLTRDNTQADTH